MRVSTSMMYDLGVNTVQQQYADLTKLQQQMGTGRRVLVPSDDPIASSRALEVSQSQSTNDQFIANGEAAKSALQMQDSVLSQITTLLQDVRVLTVNAGDPSLSNADRLSLVTDLQGRYDQLLGLANSTDGNGLYLFSGYKGTTLPFAESAPGTVIYNGDQGQRLMQISASRQAPISSSGAEVFQLIKNGNGTFVTSAANGNTGTGVVSPGVVLNPANWDATGNTKDYSIVFAQDTTSIPPVTTYDIVANVDTEVNGITYSAGDSLLTGTASDAGTSATGGPVYPRVYRDGQAIDFKYQAGDANGDTTWDLGIQVSVQGQPTSTPTDTVPLTSFDQFNVKASTGQDIFTTLQNLITSVKTPATSAAGYTQLTNNLNSSLSDITQAEDNILKVRATIGATLKEVDAHRNTSEDLALQYKGTISDLMDLDYAKAISDLQQKQVSLEAAQKSFLKIQGLSLFNFIN